MPNKYHPVDSHNSIASRLIEEFSKNEEIKVIFVSGSTIRGGTDVYSDIDINIVVSNPETFQQEFIAFVKSIEPVSLTFSPPGLSHIHVFYFGDLEKIDIGIYSVEQFMSGTHISPSEESIIKNTLGTVKQQESRKSDSDSELQLKYLSLALADLIAIPREVYRKNIFEARANLDEARSMIATYLNINNSVIYFGYNDFIQFTNPDQEKLFHISLKRNGSFKGILEAAQALLQIIATTNQIESSVIRNVAAKITAASQMLIISPSKS
jgi:predicted nucleotidyltransferase